MHKLLVIKSKPIIPRGTIKGIMKDCTTAKNGAEGSQLKAAEAFLHVCTLESSMAGYSGYPERRQWQQAGPINSIAWLSQVVCE